MHTTALAAIATAAENFTAANPHLLAHPTVQQLMEAHLARIAAGEALGVSTKKSLQNAHDLRVTIDDLNHKRITPRRVVGAGVKRPMTAARNWLDRESRLNDAGSRVGAHVHAVNLDNAHHDARHMLTPPAAATLGEHRPRLTFEPYGTTGRGLTVAHIFGLSCSCGEQLNCDVVTPTLDGYYAHVQPLVDAATDE